MPKGYGPCIEDNLYVGSEEAGITVESFDIDDTNPSFDVITVCILVWIPPGSPFPSNGITAYISLCDKEGAMICRDIQITGESCDFCMQGITSSVECRDPDNTDDEYVYEGIVTITLPFGVSAQFDGVVSTESGFEIVNSVDNGNGSWTITYSITTTDIHFNHAMALLSFIDLEGNKYCVPLSIIVSDPCIDPPVECVAAWASKQMTCTGEENGFIEFDFGQMLIYGPADYELCDGELWGTIEGGAVEVHSAHVDGLQLYFDITVLMPSVTFVSGEIYEMRIYLCDDRGNTVCYLIPLELVCENGHGSGGGEGRASGLSGFNKVDDYAIFPNPASERLVINSPMSSSTMERTARLMDSTGRLVSQINLGLGRTELSISDNLPGIYFVAIFEDGLLVKVEKVVFMR